MAKRWKNNVFTGAVPRTASGLKATLNPSAASSPPTESTAGINTVRNSPKKKMNKDSHRERDANRKRNSLLKKEADRQKGLNGEKIPNKKRNTNGKANANVEPATSTLSVFKATFYATAALFRPKTSKPTLTNGRILTEKNLSAWELYHDPRIHPIFAHFNFEGDIDYAGVIAPCALLATRLLHTKQSYHWLHANFFGMNSPSRLPSAWANTSAVAKNNLMALPEEYSSGIEIGGLSEYEKGAVDFELMVLSKRVTFHVGTRYLRPRTLGSAKPRAHVPGQWGMGSTISIQKRLHDDAKPTRGGDRGELALLRLLLVDTLLHEVAHAAVHHVVGYNSTEDFFEESLVGEAGFEYTQRVFGLHPVIRPDHLDRSYWSQWQTRNFLDPEAYPLAWKCRDARKLPEQTKGIEMDPGHAIMLLDDRFWQREGDPSFKVIPQELLRPELRQIFDTTPKTFREWCLREMGISPKAPDADEEIVRPMATREPMVCFRQPAAYTHRDLEFDEAIPHNSGKTAVKT